MEELHAIAEGRVQGVGFRATAKYYADELKLKGFARNLSQGGVEICAQGPREALESFLSRLKEDFPASYAVKYLAPTKEFVGFSIR